VPAINGYALKAGLAPDVPTPIEPGERLDGLRRKEDPSTSGRT